MLGVGAGGPLGEAGTGAPGAAPGGPGAAVTGAAAPNVPGAQERAAERLALAVLASVHGVGPTTLAALVAAFGSARAVLDRAGSAGGDQAIAAAVAGPSRRPDPALARAIAGATEGAGRFAERLGILGVTVVTLEDPWYPRRLWRLEMPPPVLFVRGRVDSLDAERAVAVVGTRRPTERGRRFATAVAAALTGCGASVVSGLALGIDGAAHAATVDAGGRTVAVLGGGHACLYPAAHAALADRIVAAGGSVVTELAPDTPAVAGTFPRRNRIIAGLADATVVVEAGPRSGALITAGWAMEQGRECFVVPGPVDTEQSLGCNRLLRLYPNQAHAVPGIPELVEDLGWAQAAGVAAGIAPGAASASAGSAAAAAGSSRGPRRPPSLEAVLASLGSVEATVARALQPRAATLDELVSATGLAPASLLAVLTRLEDRGLAVPALGRYAPAGDLATTAPLARRG